MTKSIATVLEQMLMTDHEAQELVEKAHREAEGIRVRTQQELQQNSHRFEEQLRLECQALLQSRIAEAEAQRNLAYREVEGELARQEKLFRSHIGQAVDAVVQVLAYPSK